MFDNYFLKCLMDIGKLRNCLKEYSTVIFLIKGINITKS